MNKFILLVLSVGILSCTSKSQENNQKGGDISPTEFHKMMEDSSVQVLDVRTPEEWSTGTISGANEINWFDADFSEQVTKLSKDQPVLVYCASGGRSGKAMEKLGELGFQEVYNLKGGISAWNAQELPLKQ